MLQIEHTFYVRFKRLDICILEWLNKQPEKMIDTTHEQLAVELEILRGNKLQIDFNIYSLSQ